MTLSCGRVGPFMSSFAFDVSLMSGIVDLGGGGGKKSISEHAVNVSGRCMVAQVRFLVAERRFLRMPAKCGFW